MPTLALTGDVMLGRHAGDLLARKGPRHPWGTVLPHLTGADFTFVNLECVIAASGRPVPKVFNFRAPPAAVDALVAAGVDAVTLANNHVLDYGPVALEEMLDRLDVAGIPHAGAGRDAAEAWRPAEVTRGGLKVRLLAFTDNEPGWAAGAQRPGVAHAAVDAESPSYEMLQARVRSAARGADLVVVAAHWGPNMRRTPPRAFEALARRLVAAGAHVVWGTSAHLFQRVERLGDGIVLFDTGDFLDDYVVDPVERNDRSFLFLLDVEPGSVREVRLLPVEIDPSAAQVNVVEPQDAGWWWERMGRLARPGAGDVVLEDGTLRVATRGPPRP